MKHGDHDHDHNQGTMHIHGATNGPRLWLSLLITLAFVIGETIAGYAANSLALLSDAGHNASDAMALGLAAYAIWISKKPADEKKTYGYHRVAILSALANAISLIVIGVIVLVEAIRLARSPQPVSGTLMMWVAGVSVLMNTVIAWMLNAGSKTSLNVRAAFVHMIGDALSAVAVLLAGLIVRQTGWIYADSIASTLIAMFILWTSWGILREATNILLEATPKGIDLDAVVAAMNTVEHVISVHDIHIWTVSDGMNYMSCHVVVDDAQTMEQCAEAVQRLNELLEHDFNIVHATIQVEKDGACSDKQPPLICGQTDQRGVAP